MNAAALPDDTIAAIASGLGGGLAIVRLSGPRALALAGAVWRGRRPLAQLPPRTLHLGRLRNARGAAGEQCLAVHMPGPRSYTGEDVVEFQVHGGALVARTTLDLLLAQGARHAGPGEFTRRAFLHGKLDLTQAEAVLDVIQAQTTLALHAANRQLAGVLGRRLEALHRELTELLAEVEVRLDFVEENLDWTPPAALAARLDAALATVDELLRHRDEGEILRHGLRLVLAGAPNAGKSSLLNRLLGRDRAIVTPLPGTTRDTLEEPAQVRGIPLRLVDTAGLRPAQDPIEQEGIARSHAALREAQVVLWVLDATRPLAEQRLDPTLVAGKPVLAALNKSDLAPNPPWHAEVDTPVVAISALTGAGCDELLDQLAALVWHRPLHEAPDVAINARHAALLAAARDALVAARPLDAGAAGELLAVHLRAALTALGAILGKTVAPDLLDQIFARFCIGK